LTFQYLKRDKMFWELYLQKKKRSRDGETYGLLFNNATVACQIAGYEGMMHILAKSGKKDRYQEYQGRIRRIFEKDFSYREIPKELSPDYFPAPPGWSGDEGLPG
jgi:hypothetical protein